MWWLSSMVTRAGDRLIQTGRVAAVIHLVLHVGVRWFSQPRFGMVWRLTMVVGALGAWV